jgi:hypothetical protein
MAQNRKAVSFAFSAAAPTSSASSRTPRLLPGHADSDSGESKLVCLSSERERVSFAGSEHLSGPSPSPCPRSMATEE